MQFIKTPMDINLANLHMPHARATDIVEIVIITFLFYRILIWAKNTRLWSMLKGLVVILAFIVMAVIFDMSTILWLARNVFSIAVIAMVVILQPELRKALERVGHRTLRLKREKFGPFELGDLQPGAFYVLTNEEVRNIKMWMNPVENR